MHINIMTTAESRSSPYAPQVMSKFQSFDPALTYDLASKHMVTQSYEGLIALDGQAKIVPALAASWPSLLQVTKTHVPAERLVSASTSLLQQPGSRSELWIQGT